MATIQQYPQADWLPETVVKRVFVSFHRSARRCAMAGGVLRFRSPPQSMFTIPCLLTGYLTICDRLCILNRFVFLLSCLKCECVRSVRSVGSRDNLKRTHPNSQEENAGKYIRNIRSLAFIPPYRGVTKGCPLPHTVDKT